MNTEPDSLNLKHFQQLLKTFQQKCQQIDITISKKLTDLLNVYHLQWDIGQKKGPPIPEDLEKYQDNKIKIEEFKKQIDNLKEKKKAILQKIDGYERYIAILIDRK